MKSEMGDNSLPTPFQLHDIPIPTPFQIPSNACATPFQRCAAHTPTPPGRWNAPLEVRFHTLKGS